VLGRTADGRLELDVAAIRARQAAVGSVYTPPGPHQTESARPGIGSLRNKLRCADCEGSAGAQAAGTMRVCGGEEGAGGARGPCRGGPEVGAGG
jgi:hypothetical protein